MSDLVELERRVAELEDRAAIRDLVYRYAEHIHSRREQENAGLFTPDAVFELRHADPERPGESKLRRRYEGAVAIAGSFEDVAGKGVRLWPMIHNLRIALAGDEASSTCVMISANFPHGTQFIGEYRDRYRRTEEGWRFAARAYVMFGDVADATYAAEATRKYENLKA